MKTIKETIVEKKTLLPFILITSLFFLWGLANNMTDTLLAAFKKIMSMDDFQTSIIQMVFYGSYFLLALPAALYIRKFTYKSGILVGLGLFVLGSILFYPASKTMLYGHFLSALFVLAGGLSILETSANPYIIAMGSEKTATRRLNLAQSFNPIGAISGVLLSKLFILSNLNSAGVEERASMSKEQLSIIQSDELNAVMGPYVGVAVLLVLIWIVIYFSKMPKAIDSGKDFNFSHTIKRLLKNSHYTWGVIAQFFYVGAQIGVWSFTIRFVMDELGINEEQSANYYLAALVLFMSFRFIFTGLMKFFKPKSLLAFSSGMAILSSLVVVFGSGIISVIALVAISGFMSLMFPTIYGLAVRGLGEDTKIGGSGLIMAILGGAVITAIQGQVSVITGNIHYAFLVPALCFVVIIYYALVSSKMN